MNSDDNDSNNDSNNDNDHPMRHLEDLNSNFIELWKKIIRRYDHFPEAEKNDLINRYYLIRDAIREINSDIETMLIELDASSFNLSPEEESRIQSAEEVERAIDRIKPLMLLSLMIERGDLLEPKVPPRLEAEREEK